jgi:ribosomal protein L24E
LRLNIELDEIIMPINIFHTDDGRTEAWLEVNDDGTVTYYEENSGRRMLRRGIEPRNRVMTVEEAKLDWTSHARDIDEAAAIASKGRPSNAPKN